MTSEAIAGKDGQNTLFEEFDRIAGSSKTGLGRY
jgi:hypothetical protein